MSDPLEMERTHSGVARMTRDLLELQRASEVARGELSRLRQDVYDARQMVAGSAESRLLAANEQLVISALRSQTDAVMAVLSLDSVTQAAQAAALHEQRERDALALLNDRLEQRVAERTRELERARDDALAATRAKEQFLSNMSHEIRTPMNGMLGALELLSHTGLTPLQAQYIDVAATSGEALMAILNEVLDFAKIESSQVRVIREPIDVNAIAASVTTLFSAAAQRRGIELQLQHDALLDGFRLGDALHLRQVLLNLVGNAMKFTSRGYIRVRTTLLGEGSQDRVAFEVSDTGVGIETSQQQRVFEPFIQADETPRQSIGGTGLGLAISRQLVRAMGGELSLASVLGQGSTFRFELQMERCAAVVPLEVAVPVAPGLLTGRILLVEDNPVNRLIAAAMLESLGLEVEAAEDGEEALAKLANHTFAAVLMDCQMPVLDGYEATRRRRDIESQGGLRHTPIIALTANAFTGDVERCLGAGMDAHLAKPFTMEQLQATIAAWL